MRLPLTVFALAMFAATALPGGVAMPAAAQADDHVAACLSEAQWPVTHAAAFVDGSVRTREVLLNAGNPAVGRFSTLCRQIATAPAAPRAEANAQCRQEATDDHAGANDAVRAHLERMAARCAALAG